MKLRVGTRRSKLALWQAERAIEALVAANPDIVAEIVYSDSHGDRHRDRGFAELGSVGIFTSELERALQAGDVDVAVHSLKDLPTTSPPDLALGAVLPRDDARDVLVSPFLVDVESRGDHDALAALPYAARIGTSSLRRRAELWRWRSDLEIVDARGNVPTRLQKVEDRELDGVALARAGLVRLQLRPPGTIVLEPDTMLPAPAQGTIALQCRRDDETTCARVATVDDPATRVTTAAERSLLHLLEGGCRVPLGALAELNGQRLTLRARLCSPDGRKVLEHELTGNAAEPDAVAQQVADVLRSLGGDALLQQLRA